MTDLVPIPIALFDRLARAGLDVDAILRPGVAGEQMAGPSPHRAVLSELAARRR